MLFLHRINTGTRRIAQHILDYLVTLLAGPADHRNGATFRHEYFLPDGSLSDSFTIFRQEYAY